MASGPLVGGGGGKHRWASESKVYTRKTFNKTRNPNPPPQPSSLTLPQNPKQDLTQQPPSPPQQLSTTPPPALQQQQRISRFDFSTSATSDDTCSRNRHAISGSATASRDPLSNNGFGDNSRVTISLSSLSKHELRQLRHKFSCELDKVRNLVKKLEAHELQFTYNCHQLSTKNTINNGAPVGALKRVNSVTARELRPLHQLSVSIVENVQNSLGRVGVTDTVEKEKRTPKANQYYCNSDFLLGKERLPPPDSNKKLKSNGGSKKHGGAGVGDNYGTAMGAMDANTSRAFKNCGALLAKLMKHKDGWVFNTPVDVKALGLHDYYIIIKHPMDLGTIKSRLSKNWYKSPREFAEDVKLTFNNAMTYNPKGQDVHIMAETLLKVFEERWPAIEDEYDFGNRFNVDWEVSSPGAQVMKKVPPPEMRRALDRSESMSLGVDSKPKVPVSCGRVAAPKKPKAKDPNKRDMTYEEKQKLSTNLMNLPPEKLDNIINIIKKRNTSLSQHDDEIEVDIESFDAETLWELDRFVTNYKKSLSKNKKKAELAIQARREAVPNGAQETNPASITVEVVKESKTDEKNEDPSSPVEREKHGDIASRSSTSSSSSSDSGSSSSDSDSDSSSASDGPRSPGT